MNTTETTYIYPTSSGYQGEKVIMEELRTIGLSGNNSSDITENQIRSEQGQNPRGGY